jgi:hypothetical protein
MHSRRLLALLPFVAIGVAIACSGSGEGGAAGDTPWVTQVDSTGDTIRVRITGAVPANLVRRLVAEVSVGAEDGEEEETFGAITSILPLTDGSMLVYDDQAKALRRFDSTGAFTRNVGQQGGGPGEYEHMNGVTQLPDGRIVLWDAGGARLNVYAPSGDFETTWRLPFSGFFAQNILWSDRSGRVSAMVILGRDSVDFRKTTRGLIRLDDKGAVLDSVVYPLWREPAPALIAQAPDKTRMSMFSMPFWPANQARPTPLGGLVSGPGDPYVLYVTGRDGEKPLRIEREYTPVPVSATERSEQRAMAENGLRQTDPNWKWTVAEIPQTKPAYKSFFVALDGRIWVEVSVPGEPIPAADLPTPPAGQPALPTVSTREPSVYDVFSPEGRLLGRVALPPKTSARQAIGNRLWAVQRDSLDVPYAVRFRVDPALP